MDISIIFVSYNTKYFLEHAVNSVINAALNFSIEIIIVDNNSTDGSIDYLNSNIDYPLTIIKNESNIGFAAANNIGIKHTTGKYVLLLNPDTVIQRETLKTCFDFAEGSSNLGAIGVRMVDGSGSYLPESKRAIPTPANSLWKLSRISNLFPRSKYFGNYNLGHLDNEKDAQVEVLCGAFMFMPRRVLSEVGGLDEDYFMYGEDIDLSYKINKSGYDIHYLGSHSIIHYKGQSTKKSSLNYVNTFYSAMSIFANKHYGSSKLLVFLLGIGIYLRRFGSMFKRMISHFAFIFLDALLFFVGFHIIKNLWAKYQFNNPNYYTDSNITLNIFIYVIIWISCLCLLRSYKRYAHRLVFFYGVLLGLVIVLITYSLLPDSYRSSRAIILLGAVWVLLVGWIARTLVKWFGYQNDDEVKRIGIVGEEIEYNRAQKLISKALGEHVEMKQISPINISSNKIIAEQKFHQLNELVFCLKDISIETVLSVMSNNISGLQYKLFGSKSLSIVGSRKSNELGEVYGLGIQYQISNEHNKYYKRLIDICLSFVLLLCYPILIFSSNFRNNISIRQLLFTIMGKYSLVGYNSSDTQLDILPGLKEGLVPCNRSEDDESMHQLNTAYALQYTPWRDIVLLLNTIF